MLGMECCLGARTISVQGQAKAVSLASTGLLPGCGQAVSLARCILYPVLAYVYRRFTPGITLRSYVDDIRIITVENLRKQPWALIFDASVWGLH